MIDGKDKPTELSGHVPNWPAVGEKKEPTASGILERVKAIREWPKGELECFYGEEGAQEFRDASSALESAYRRLITLFDEQKWRSELRKNDV